MVTTQASQELDGELIISQLWERNYDPYTRQIIENLPIEPTWRCADLGAGAGSMAYWLAERAERGSVLAVDIDTDRLARDRAANLTVRQLDLATARLPDKQFDLILARAVLSNLPDPDEALAHAISRLAPGGWIVIEDFYFLPPEDSATEVNRAVTTAYVSAFKLHGVDARWIRRVPARLAQAGLEGVTTRVRPLGPGQGADENELMRARLQFQGQPLVDAGLVSAELVAEFVENLDRPESQDVATLQFSIWGRRPR
jgi:SAM-dependent methyltransferase